MNRIDKLFQVRTKNILSVFFTAGYPLIGSTAGIIRDLARAGADMVEIGIPFSDPLADGPVIENSSKKALQNGMNLGLLFRQLADIRKSINVPLLMMGYINPVIKFGMENFCRKCAETGIDGTILPDLPPEIFIAEYSRLFEKYNLYNIFLITPQSDVERIRMIDSISKGFIYMVSSFATTGMKGDFTESQLSFFRKVKDMNLVNHVLIGFGISDRNTFASACNLASGAIVGSAFVNMLGRHGDGFENIRRFIHDFKPET